MEIERLPVKIDPLRYAKAKRELTGAVPLAQMVRLQEHLASKVGAVDVVMSFSIDDDGKVAIDIAVRGVLPLICQRCLDEYDFEIDSKNIISPIFHDREADDLPSHYEPFLMRDDLVMLADIVEEEVLLNIPLVPTHAVEDCALAQDQAYYAAEEKEVLDETHRPFEVLSQLKD